MITTHNSMWTPWGRSVQVHAYHPKFKIVLVETAAGGGIAVADDLPMSEPLSRIGEVANGYRWFEEDSAWAAAVLAYPGEFSPDRVLLAKARLRDDYPEAYTEHFGESLTEADSQELAKRAWEASTRDKFVVVAAYGPPSFCNLPEGHVYACGFRRRDEVFRGFLVPLHEYVNPMRLVLDRFPRWEPDRTLPCFKGTAAA